MWFACGCLGFKRSPVVRALVLRAIASGSKPARATGLIVNYLHLFVHQQLFFTIVLCGGSVVQWLGRWICVRLACDLREVVSGSSVVQWLGHWFCVRLLQITNREKIQLQDSKPGTRNNVHD